MRRTYTQLVGVVLVAAAAACGQPAATASPAALSSPCPGPAALSTPQVTAMINPVPTSDPLGPSYISFALQVPQAAELLVVVVEAYPTSKTSLVPTFVGPNGQTLTRDQLARDDITGGNPGDLGFSELMHIPSPMTGIWTMRLHNMTGTQITVNVRATALFHLHLTPLVTIDAQPVSGHAPLTVTFDASSTKLDGGTATYCWNFTDGVTAWGAKTSHTFRKPGDYFVELTVTDNQGRQGYAGAKVTVAS
jgi:hypothetical protein